jgi:hypothetical protein
MVSPNPLTAENGAPQRLVSTPRRDFAGALEGMPRGPYGSVHGSAPGAATEEDTRNDRAKDHRHQHRDPQGRSQEESRPR